MSAEDPDEYRLFPGADALEDIKPLGSVEEFALKEARRATAALNLSAILEQIHGVVHPLETRIGVNLHHRSSYGQETKVTPTKDDPSNRETEWTSPKARDCKIPFYISTYRYLRKEPQFWSGWRLSRTGLSRTGFQVFPYRGKIAIELPEKETHQTPMVVQLVADGQSLTRLAVTCDYTDMAGFKFYPNGRSHLAKVVHTNPLMHQMEDHFRTWSHDYGMVGVAINLGTSPSIEFKRTNYYSQTQRTQLTIYPFKDELNQFGEGGVIENDDFLDYLKGLVQLCDPEKTRYYTPNQQRGRTY